MDAYRGAGRPEANYLVERLIDAAAREVKIDRVELPDTGADVPKAIEEFHEIYYGAAAAPMRAYFELIQNLARFPPQGEGQHWWCCRAPMFTDAGIEKARALFRQALAAAPSEAIRDRVRRGELSLRYLELRRLQQFAVRDGLYAPVGLDRLRALFPAFTSDSHRLGVTRWGEEAAVAKDEKAFTDTLRSYTVLTLENAALRLRIAPELNARVVSITDKRGGRELLNQPASVEMNYPDRSGLSVSVYPDYVGASPFPVVWRAEPSSDARELRFTGTTSEGLKLRRRIALAGDDARFHTETSVENASGKAIQAVLQSQFDADAGRMEDASVEFTAVDGRQTRQRFLEPGGQPLGGQNYLGPQVPAGEWRIVNRSGGRVLANRFDVAQAARCMLGWSAKNANRVSLGLWSGKRTLGPGEVLRLDSDYALTAVLP